jgi:hypothetical protein
MVAATHNPPEEPAADLITTLTDRDGQLLNNLFALGRSPFALATHENLSLREVLLWLAQPRIAAAITLIATSLAEGLKTEALEILREIARDSEDPVERRRATTQILRALNPPRERTPRPAQRTPTVREGPSSRTDDLDTPASSALAQLAAAETFRSKILNTYGASLDETLDAEEDAELDEEADEDDADEDEYLDEDEIGTTEPAPPLGTLPLPPQIPDPKSPIPNPFSPNSS